MTAARRRVAQALGALAAAWLAGCGTGPFLRGASGDAAPASWRLVDLMPEFWDFWAQAETLPEGDRFGLFRRLVIERHPTLYTRQVLRLEPDAPYDGALATRWMAVQRMLGPRMAVMRRLSQRMGHDLRRYEASFRRAFPDFTYRGDVVLMHSLGSFDGATRRVDGRETLLFGLDMITWVYGEEADPEAFFHHELFHVHHMQASGLRNESVLSALWGEGLATYVAKTLNPRASDLVVFGLPRSTPGRVRRDLPRLAAMLRERLDSRSREDLQRFFTGSDERPEVPARSGYVVGWMVARTLARQHPLAELARMPLAQVRPGIEAALDAMAAGAAG